MRWAELRVDDQVEGSVGIGSVAGDHGRVQVVDDGIATL
jgi:hypothetical protein